MIIELFIMAGLFGAPRESDKEACERLSAALDNPEAVAELESWYQKTPKHYLDSFYYKDAEGASMERMRNRSYNRFVSGPYRAELTIDKKLVNLNEWANVGARFDSAGELWTIYVGDSRYVHYIFRTRIDKDIAVRSSKLSKSGVVGVYCSGVGRTD